MIITLAILFRHLLGKRLVHHALERANKGVAGSMEGHAAMGMSVIGDYVGKVAAFIGGTSTPRCTRSCA
jgi:hypothetical protein